MWRVINYLNFKIKSEIPSVVKVVQLCILYNQRDATYTMFFIINSAPHVSGGFSDHHQELVKLYLQFQFQHIHTSGRQQESMTIPKAANRVL